MFPRANEGGAGRHGIAVSLPGSDDYIRPIGITMPIPDRRLLNDPEVLVVQRGGVFGFGFFPI